MSTPQPAHEAAATAKPASRAGKPHPDRVATTLAQRALLEPAAFEGPFAPPDPGSDDARVDLKLLAFAACEALRTRGTELAHGRLAGLTGADLWAGTVQDGTARGFMVALEEVISLCEPAPIPPEPVVDVLDGEALDAAALRRRRDLLVASAGARIRFSRKGGILFVDRARETHVENCLHFEDRADVGTLDGFVPREGERARLFHPGYLTPVRLEQNSVRDRLVLEGRLGRNARGHPCQLEIEGRKSEHVIRLAITVENRFLDHRLRVRFAGFPPSTAIRAYGTPGWEDVHHAGRRFRAATLVRACGRLRVGELTIAVPAAQCIGSLRHEFVLGGDVATSTLREKRAIE